MVDMKLAAFTPRRFRRRVFGQLWMLALQFVLGMLLNLGIDALDAKHIIYNSVLIGHILNAIGLVEGSLYIVLKEPSKLTWWALIATAAAFCAGGMTVLTKQDVWSFAMACGFLVSAWLYFLIYVRADRRIRNEQ
jgi:hypothetical protein